MKNFSLFKKFFSNSAIFLSVLTMSAGIASASVITSISGGANDLTNLTLGSGGVTDLTGASTNLTPDIYRESANNPSVTFVVNNVDSLGVLQPTATAVTPSGAFDVYYVHSLSGEFAGSSNGSVTFSGPVLGVAGTNGFNNSASVLNGTSNFEVPGVLYLGTQTSGILEGANDSYSISGNTVNFTQDPFNSGAGNFRIFVENVPASAPEPTSLVLLGIGALGLLSRRKR